MKNNTGLKKILPEDLRKKLQKGEELTLIDTLTNDHFNKAHIAKSKNACVFEVTFLDNVKNIISEKDREIILYGSSDKSMDAVTAAEKLLRSGYQKVFVLDGGLKQWEKMGYELVGDDPGIVGRTEPALALQDWKYVVDIEQSIIEWTGRNANAKHYGTIQLSNGEIIVKEGQISGYFGIDMKSIKNINLEGDPLQPVLIDHLVSDDFFFVKMFPKVTFILKSAKPIKEATPSEPNFEIEGVLKLRGIHNDINFLANANVEQGGEVKIESHFDIDRTRWGVIYGSTRFFEHLGMHIVFDFISIQIRLVAR